LQLESRCICGNNKFLVFSEKMYEGYINEQGILTCEPDEQHIEIIKCSACSKKYTVQDFRGIDY